jgi:hypothetical protein
LFFGVINLRLFIIREKIDFVHIHWPIPLAFLSLLIPKKIPVFYTFYTAEMVFFKKLPDFILSIFKIFIKRSKLNISISSYTAMLFKKMFPDLETTVIPPAMFF